MEQKVATFQFLGYRVVESVFNHKLDGETASHIKTDFEVEGRNDDADSIFLLTVKTHITDDNGVLDAKVAMVGQFKYDKTVSETQRNNFFTINGPAILFPYIRAYISTLTALGGTAPIVLPTFNFAKVAQAGNGN